MKQLQRYRLYVILNKNNMSLINQKLLTLIKFSPAQILFRHNQSKIIYKYFDSSQNLHYNHHVTHEALLRGNIFNKGVIYQKQQSNLQQQIIRRCRTKGREQLNQEQIVNTFIPLFQCLMHIHDNHIVHSSIHLQNILIVNQEIKLRDWLAPTKYTTQYYPQGQASMDDDFEALGKCLLTCLTLDIDQNKQQIKVQNLLDKYSKFITIIALILSQNLRSYYRSIVYLLQGQAKYIDGYLKKLYEQLKRAKQMIKNNQITQKQAENVTLYMTKLKKIIVNQSKRQSESDNIENKLEMMSSKKSQKIIRHGEKNYLVQQLMNKKLNEEETKAKESSLKRTVNKSSVINVSNFGIQNTIKKRNYRERNSPGQIVRQFSKKK